MLYDHPKEDFEVIRANAEKTLERFWKYVNKTPKCWIWIGPQWSNAGLYRYGYIGGVKGSYNYKHKIRAHRLSYILLKGDIPYGHVIDHTCHNRLCVRPDHLRITTLELNAADQAKGRSVKVFGNMCVNCMKEMKAIKNKCQKEHKMKR